MSYWKGCEVVGCDGVVHDKPTLSQLRYDGWLCDEGHTQKLTPNEKIEFILDHLIDKCDA